MQHQQSTPASLGLNSTACSVYVKYKCKGLASIRVSPVCMDDDFILSPKFPPLRAASRTSRAILGPCVPAIGV